jgi:hypothetical protein
LRATAGFYKAEWSGRSRRLTSRPLHQRGATAIIHGLADYLTGPIPRNVDRPATGFRAVRLPIR